MWVLIGEILFMDMQKIIDFFQSRDIQVRLDHQKEDQLIIVLPIFGKPGSKVEKLAVDESGNIKVFIKERAVDGAANKGLLKFLSKKFGLSQSSMILDKGQKSKIKKIKMSFSFTKEKDVSYYLKKMESAFE